MINSSPERAEGDFCPPVGGEGDFRFPTGSESPLRLTSRLKVRTVLLGLLVLLVVMTASVLVGAGGLGSAALLYLASSGMGRITVCDGDRVDLTNLQRQVIHRVAAIGSPKAASAA